MKLIKEVHPQDWRPYSFRAMGSKIALWLETADSGAAGTAFTRVEALFAANEQALSRFRPESELSRLNARSGQWVAVSELLWEVLALAISMAATTDGRFDPTMLNALEQCGYTDSFEKPADSGRNKHHSNFAPFPGQWTAVALDEKSQAVCLPPGVRLDLGGIAKGYTAQQAVELMRPFGPCLVDAGGDLVAGDGPAGYPGWPVAVGAPSPGEGHETADLFTAWLANRSLATSGIDYRTWYSNGRAAHHLLDPTTGRPAETDALTVTILADEAATAEAWATATLVAGSLVGMDALLNADLAGLMVLKNGRILATPLMHRCVQSGSFLENK